MKLSAIIIDDRQHARRIDAGESRPRSLDTIGESARPVLDWTLQTLGQFGVTDPLYVGGYHIEKVIGRFPTLRVRYHNPIDGDGDVGALMCCEPEGTALLIVSASTILLPGSVERLTRYPVTRGVYGESRPLGVYFLGADLVERAFEQGRALVQSNRSADLAAMFDAMADAISVDLDGLAAPVIDQEAVARAIFRGKAQTLDNLAPLLRGATFLPRERIALRDWRGDPTEVLARVNRAFGNDVVVVRSSVSGEDSLNESQAGRYLSVLDVCANDAVALRRAIEDVVASYGALGQDFRADHEILVQPQVRNIRASGVMLTRDPRSGAPYFVVNEDRSSGRSDSVTAGAGGAIEQRFIAWSAIGAVSIDEDTQRLLDLGKELIRLSRLDALDVEYAVGADGRIFLLQVRPLAAARHRPDIADDDVLDLAAGARAFVAERMRPVEGLVGRGTVFGVMPDWNPAEMIGSSPRTLSLSLYQLLIGQEAWAEARSRIGYRDARPEPLIVSLGGHPFVDVRCSFNSFIPATVEDATAARWVDACLERLRADPALHDKIEFEIAITCLAPDWDIAARRLTEAGLDANEFGGHLRSLTADILTGTVEPIDHQLAALDRLAERRGRHIAVGAADIHQCARLVAHLLTDCRQLGVVAFSILARYAFISMSFLRGLARTGVIDDDRYEAFLRALPTVAGTIAGDLGRGLPSSALVERYGHLRPNSYEITSPNYAANPACFLKAPAQAAMSHAWREPESILLDVAPAIRRALDALRLDVDVAQLVRFLTRSIAGREHAKFEFTKNLNAALEATAALGKELGLDREQVSFLAISDVLRLETDSLMHADRGQLRRRAAYNRKRWAAGRTMRLPHVVLAPDDVLAFRLEVWRANFITRKRVEARAIWLDDEGGRPDLSGAIVVIRAADPGYDWVFAHNIAGLITEYGGIASHMSIRAAEFGLPAAIGCGAVVMEALRGAPRIELDCSAERVRALPC